MAISLVINGAERQADSDPATPLLYVLRDDFKLNGAKYGCGLGQCGSCTVMMDGEAVLSCVTPILAVQGREVTTVEGLGTEEEPGPEAEIRQALAFNLCRCGTHMRILAAIRRAGELMRQASVEPERSAG
jgi:aerobic-type carbon monoxide dehydrogenase small subunit (CoxS/CutS family)